jgi:hypothetical protein
MSIVCDTGFINIVDPFLNPDSTVWTGSITYTLQYATTVAGATLVEARQVINVSDGIDICLAPGLYTVVYNQSGQRLPVTSQWTVPPTGGPYTIADLEGVGPVTGSLTVTGPFIAMSTVTMTSLINAAARPYVATDSVGLLSTGNLALVAISGSASDLASGTVAAARGGAGTLSGLLKANGAGVVSAAVAGTDYAVATNGTNAQFLTSNGAGGFGTAVSSTGTGSVVLATSPTLTTPDLGTPSVLVLTNATGLPAAAMPGLTGDVTSSAGSVATTVVKINGTTLATLATGILKNTTATGVPSIAVAGTDYSVATNGTNGQALTSNGTGGFSTALTLATVATSGSASDLTAGTLAAARGGAGTLTGILKANGAGVVSAATAGTDYAVATNGTIGQALTSNGTGGFSTALTLATVATSGSASDLGSGTLSAARLPALTGDATSSVGSAATTVVKINGTALSGLATGLLKNTTTTGVPSIAVAGTDYAVATNGTLGQALTSNGTGGFSTALTLATVATSGSASDLTAGTLAAARMPALTGDVTTTVGTVATTVSKINGTTLSGLATGLLKNTTATGVPSIAVAGTDLIGGVGNLTTVGSVPYVSATGTLSQDATVFFWDATNNRLGIGTATPATTLQVSGGKILLDNAQGIQFKDSAGTARTILQVDSGDNVYLDSAAAGGDTFFRALGVDRMTIKGTSGNVGIGTTGPTFKLDVATSGASGTFRAYDQTASTGSTLAAFRAGIAQSTNPILTVNNNANTVVFSVNSTGIATTVGAQVGTSFTDASTTGVLQLGNASTALSAFITGNVDAYIYKTASASGSYPFDGFGHLVLQGRSLNTRDIIFAGGSTPAARMVIQGSGNVGIGTTAPVYLLDVAKSGASGTARFYDQTASTGVTSVQVRVAANQGTSPLQTFSDVNGVQLFTVESNGNIAGWISGQYNKAYEISSKNTNATNGGVALSTLSASTMTEVMRLTATLNVGIGTPTPNYKLEVLGSSNTEIARVGDGTRSFGISTYTPNSGGVTLRNSGTGLISLTAANAVLIGTSYAGLGTGVPANTVAIEGNVGIGTTTPVYGLDVAKSGASGTARFYDQTASTGATRVLISLGVLDTASTQVFEIAGLMKFSGLNSTGAGTALLSTNSPAVTNTAPYTWFKVLTSDGSTGYIPVWK